MASSDLPPPPWGRPQPAPPRRQLSREAIVAAALRVIDDEGLDALSMRRVAQELSTGAASLYAHFAGKDELLDAVQEKVIGEVDFSGVAALDDWQEQVKEWARTIRRTFHRHRDVSRAFLGRIPTGVSALEGSELLLAALRGGGVPDQAAAYGIDLLALLVNATAFEESLFFTQFGADEAKAPEMVEQLRAYFRSLPADRLPHTVALADALTAWEGEDARFEFALDLIVRGFAALAKD
jgi:AcrR family transcriptional regulator